MLRHSGDIASRYTFTEVYMKENLLSTPLCVEILSVFLAAASYSLHSSLSFMNILLMPLSDSFSAVWVCCSTVHFPT